LSAALKQLQKDTQSIELLSSTTVGQLTAIRVAFHTLNSDGVSLTSESALATFENSLVTTNASAVAAGTTGTLTNNSGLQTSFQALYTTSTPPLSTSQINDLNVAYNALAAAVTSANITTANITTINLDWTTVLAAQTPPGSTTSTFPYFNLVVGTGAEPGGCDGGFGGGGWMGGGGDR